MAEVLPQLLAGPLLQAVTTAYTTAAAMDANHWGVAAVLLLGAVQSSYMLVRKPCFRASDPTTAATDDSGDRFPASRAVKNVTHSYLVHPSTLATFRLLAFATIAAVSLHQLHHYPLSRLAIFYTVWNWWLLGAYFLVAAATHLLERIAERSTNLPTIKSHGAAAAGAAAGGQGKVDPSEQQQVQVLKRVAPLKLPGSRGAGAQAPAGPDGSVQAPDAAGAGSGRAEVDALLSPATPQQSAEHPGEDDHSSIESSSPLASLLPTPSTPTIATPSSPAATCPATSTASPGWFEPSALHSLASLAAVLFHINVTTASIVTVVNWAVLYPMMLADPDPARAAVARALLCNFTGYMQHGTNMALILTDMALNAIPYELYIIGAVGAEALVYALVAFAHHAATGRWTYPFLDTSKPYAALAYLGVYLLHWLFYLLFWGLYGAKMWALGRLERGRLLGVHSRVGG